VAEIPRSSDAIDRAGDQPLDIADRRQALAKIGPADGVVD